MAYQTAAGASLSISATPPATFDAVGYGALTPTIVGEITNIGDFFGREYALVTHNPLAGRATKKGKGSYNNGTINPQLALDPDDAGQTAMITARDSDDAVAVGVTLQDGTEYWCMGLVMSFMANVGGVDDVVTATSTIEVDHRDWVQIAA
ncbi:hypothetical protein GTA62_14715 [Roseobacter sp. HKCCD9010]|uniref:hypothetical protein n=1 Tax=unclassified Roseobacter TaxID=196798 RepID=UPI00149217AB|nr:MULTISPECIES: hypothetical protein [unclassified Roseobacter]MBF9050637.1 hypothetical protein [Rhodobacterales bacterium HKCCD4356]NNV11945.1 hypothetical protein [Roseobacter sp. HKCCD7357]NNV16958.1 hypothetical protein [Roseobacter sp. HKCCD8768]NNV26187.1 hypothetical protein [Roseobacter sp. HKCCD8192]NNV30682.1 hypothetical protein [Roseobacter sp. HKCCD9061]